MGESVFRFQGSGFGVARPEFARRGAEADEPILTPGPSPSPRSVWAEYGSRAKARGVRNHSVQVSGFRFQGSVFRVSGFGVALPEFARRGAEAEEPILTPGPSPSPRSVWAENGSRAKARRSGKRYSVFSVQSSGLLVRVRPPRRRSRRADPHPGPVKQRSRERRGKARFRGHHGPRERECTRRPRRSRTLSWELGTCSLRERGGVPFSTRLAVVRGSPTETPSCLLYTFPSGIDVCSAGSTPSPSPRVPPLWHSPEGVDELAAWIGGSGSLGRARSHRIAPRSGRRAAGRAGCSVHVYNPAASSSWPAVWSSAGRPTAWTPGSSLAASRSFNLRSRRGRAGKRLGNLSAPHRLPDADPPT